MEILYFHFSLIIDVYSFPSVVAQELLPLNRGWVPCLPAPLEGDCSFECYERTLQFLYSYRSIGIPCVLDAVPYWGNSNGSHYWAAVMDPFFPDRIPEELAFRKVPKVYRMSYRHERSSVWEYAGRKADFFKDGFWEDVTDRYVSTADVEITVPRAYRDCEAVYLCVFNQGEWKPVAGVFQRGGKACFDRLGCDIVYLPVCYKSGRQSAVGNPFILGFRGKVRELVCSEAVTNFTAHRKYPYNLQATGGSSMVGTLFECANRPDYSDSKVFYGVRENTLMEARKVPCPDKSYRYWRIRPYTSMALAELSFIRGGETARDFKVTAMEPVDVCFDGNPLTYGNYRGVVDFDFGKAVRLDSICYLPLNDGNGIFPGNLYELCYWEGGCWKTFYTKKAEGYSLQFEQVPAGGLYWLRNVTAGRQERIFIVEGDRVKFY